MAHISSLLLRLAKKYQIPNFDEESALLLAEDVLERYKFDLVDVVVKCLEFPPHTGEKNWRLTPDTINEWMAITLEKEAQERERELTKSKAKDTLIELSDSENISESTRILIKDYLNSLSGPKMVQAMTDEDVKKYGKERLKKEAKSLGYVPPNKEYLIEKELRRRWSNEVHDKYTGKPLENWISFDEWKLI